MCIAIVKRKDGKITDQQLKNCFDNNKHGAGIAYTMNGKVHVIKGIFDKDKFIKTVRKVENISDGAMLIHCRISTSGLVDDKNCHPHWVHNNCVMIHNGILDIDVPNNSDKSDTVIFTEEILSKLPKNFMFKDYMIQLLEFAVGFDNKLCFLNGNGKYAIVNEDEGEWVNNVWFSNDSYKEPRRKVYYNYHSYYDYSRPYTNYFDRWGATWRK